MLPLLVYIIFYLVLMIPMLCTLMEMDGYIYIYEIMPNSAALRYMYMYGIELIAGIFAATYFGPLIAISLWSIGCSSTLIIQYYNLIIHILLSSAI